MTDPVRVSLRLPQPGDVRALAEAERECFDDPWPARYFSSEIFAPGRFHRVLVDASETLVAYLFTAWQYLDLHVLKVATRPDFRRQGFGRRLMTVAERHAVEMAGETVTLEVRTGNAAAIAMYRDMGYDEVGIREGYYADLSDALVMTKRVGEP